MTNKHQYVVIMAGGGGTRLWPHSRNHKPKQFQDILGKGKTLLQETIARFLPICPSKNIYIVTHQDYVEIVKAQLPFLQDEQILAEPIKRNTAPCIAYASYKIKLKDPKACIVVTPADQIIDNQDIFTDTIQKALKKVANNDYLLTIGITPTRPDTGYGYIQYEEEFARKTVKKVKTFIEKPDLATAIKFLESGEFFWNSGIFIWNVQSITRALERYLTETAELFHEAQIDFFTEREKKAIEKVYAACASDSIDKGVMEKADNVYMINARFQWSDVGTWKSLYDISAKDSNNNVLVGNQLIYQTKNCIINTPKERLVVVQGLDNYIIVEHDNVLMICRKEDEQLVRDFVIDAKSKGSEFV
ncbi:MAG: mannose-1-phosphate guanylyltransferase [Microscillaceae bacterium]|nr:mannose-1-phosphate guanylyltransferase [Microscillaceae bacterium]MDW8459979.1 mannose-1-phosphate guanylyltransferase [Cytophagales bacterium]